MKIAILTLPLHTNYGGILQCYALQTSLKRIGHTVIEVEKEKYQTIHTTFWRYIYIIPHRLFNKLKGSKQPVFYEYIFNSRILPKQIAKDRFIRANTEVFINAHIERRIYENLSSVKNEKPDVIVVGSDQIWRAPSARYNFGSVADAFLDFAKTWELRRIGYAISFGTDDWEYTPQETTVCSELIQKFDAISVREDSAVSICKDRLSYLNAVQVIDPTMLLEKNDYCDLINNYPLSDGSLFSYILDDCPACTRMIASIARVTGLKPFFVNSKENDDNRQPQPPVEQWLSAFRDAEMIVTDSFHGCVFSIIFNKPFWVVGNKKRGYARFESLLKLFNLQERLISPTDFETTDWTQDIDWNRVNTRLAALKQIGLNFLKDNL